eukprot:1744880-Prymnesium_polylepis.2
MPAFPSASACLAPQSRRTAGAMRSPARAACRIVGSSASPWRGVSPGIGRSGAFCSAGSTTSGTRGRVRT